MTILAQLSDLHLQAGDDDRGAARALRTAVAAVLDLRPAPDAVLVSGDLGERGEPAEYALARELLAPLPMPVHVLAGNHDDHEALSEAFGTPVRYTTRVGRGGARGLPHPAARADGGAARPRVARGGARGGARRPGRDRHAPPTAADRHHRARRRTRAPERSTAPGSGCRR